MVFVQWFLTGGLVIQMFVAILKEYAYKIIIITKVLDIDFDCMLGNHKALFPVGPLPVKHTGNSDSDLVLFRWSTDL